MTALNKDRLETRHDELYGIYNEVYTQLTKYIVDDQRDVTIKKKIKLKDLTKHYISLNNTFMTFKSVIEDMGKQIRGAPDTPVTLEDIKNLQTEPINTLKNGLKKLQEYTRHQ